MKLQKEQEIETNKKLVKTCERKTVETIKPVFATQNMFNCAFLEHKKHWLSHRLTAPKNLEQLRSFFGYVHNLGKLIPNFSELCHPLRPLLKKNTKFILNNKLELHLQQLKEKVANATENKP